MAITTKDWDAAIHHLNVVKSRYKTLSSTPKKIKPGLILELEELEIRYNSSERTEELYRELLEVE